MKIAKTMDSDFEALFRRITGRGRVFDEDLWRVVKEIVDDVARRGDAALFECTERLDGYVLTAETVAVSENELEKAAARVEASDLAILRQAAQRIESFHRHQIAESWTVSEKPGATLGQRILPLERVGIYAPGGLASYPSTVLMAAIPAKIAGVQEILLVNPSKGGQVQPLIAAAAKLCGIDRIFKIGGAQAVAALAYGTETIPRVDKIVGPGNAYVAAAKKMVFGQVSIDMIAGPSEILIIADGSAQPDLIAADLLSQAEHDEMASAILLTPDEALARAVSAEVERQLKRLPRRVIAERSLEAFGAILVTEDLEQAVAVANRFAPEHLELMVADPWTLLEGIRHAGAVFLGHYTPEALGDYIAGPNHVLPTGGTARFSSALGVYDFVKRISVLSFSREALEEVGPQAARFAHLEGLDAHGNSISLRLTGKNP
ncbi:histidinol dehydrogenase [Syntrophus gentianae]|uniref:Histidinol dehydrogenase n=1 Tax=Syntrophus gentianae TaxID=43775 RepID=A0A1H7UFD5_9BACT|nr:histidinol dehydrogenase [Syntrophus gentianae]SEL95750.1 histidinol dehydrogenase [Syntrophus gentianae]